MNNLTVDDYMKTELTMLIGNPQYKLVTMRAIATLIAMDADTVAEMMMQAGVIR